jgi:organic hydroperoxide reductase OsmC/OhrA
MTASTATVSWELKAEDDFPAGHYSRAHTIAFDGGARLTASASPEVVPRWADPAGADPEEMLLASLASCHMLWFLDLARRDGWVVERYTDTVIGHMGQVDGHTALATATLRPLATFAGPAPDADKLASLHHHAHALCFIANSLKTDISIEPAAA